MQWKVWTRFFFYNYCEEKNPCNNHLFLNFITTMILKRPLLQYVHYIALICWRGCTEALQLFSQTALILCDRTIAEK